MPRYTLVRQSARLDGAGALTIFVRIVARMLSPALAVMSKA